VNFHGERRQNATHQSTTDPEARLAKKGAGKEAKLCYTESVLMENRNGILLDLRVGQASGRAASKDWRCCSGSWGAPHQVAGDKGYDTAAFEGLGARPAYHQLAWIRGEPTSAQASRGDLRLDQEGR
jgi:hypothetical protein